MQQMKAVIQPTEGMERIIVKPGETTVIGYGSPYKFDFVRDRRPERDGRREDREDPRLGGRRTTASTTASLRRRRRPPQGRQAGQREHADEAGRGQPRLEKHGWQGMWKPITDSVPLKEAEVEVQLVEKNKLFGKVESDWK